MNNLCQFCQRVSTLPSLARGECLFDAPHEGASLRKCTQCASLYLCYFVEHRDDSLSYYCPIAAEQWLKLRELIGHADLQREVRAIVCNREVFFSAPWMKQWADGARVCVDARPW